MVRWLEAQRLRRELHTGVDTDRRGAEILEHKASPLGGARRVLVRSSSGRTSRAARDAGVTPRLLQRQRDLLEDPLGDQPRRVGHRLPDAGLLQGDARGRQDRSVPGVDGHLARSAVHRPPSDGGQPENALTGTIFTVNGVRTTGSKSRRRTGRCASGATLPTSPTSAPARSGGARRHAGLRVGRGPRQRLPAGGSHADVIDDRQRLDRGTSRTTDRPMRREWPLTTWSCTRRQRRVWCSAPAPSSGPGVSTASTIAATRRRVSTCSRPRSISSPTWSRSPHVAAGAASRLGLGRRRAACFDITSPADGAGVPVRRSRSPFKARRATAPPGRSEASRCRSTPGSPGTRPRAASPGPTCGRRRWRPPTRS